MCLLVYLLLTPPPPPNVAPTWPSIVIYLFTIAQFVYYFPSIIVPMAALKDLKMGAARVNLCCGKDRGAAGGIRVALTRF